MQRAQANSKRPLTSRQLAILLGVSQSAVSRAFTPGSSIAEELRERILQGARRFGYEPNAIASMLSTSRTRMVGIVVSEMRNPFYPILVERLTQELQLVGLQSLLFNVTHGAQVEEQLAALRRYHVDAVVVVSATALSERDLAWATNGRDVILLNRQGSKDVTTVCCDNTAGARAIADHLHVMGRHRVGYVVGLTGTAVSMERRDAFVSRVAELGMRLVGTVSYESYSYEAGWRGALELLSQRPDAIFFASDILALGGIDALRMSGGIVVPDDIAVAGFDDVAMAAWPRYDLTTYRQPVDELVQRTVKLLASGAGNGGVHCVLPGELVVRSSTRAWGNRRSAVPCG